MGEVYRAHDPRLGRDVAIKVLPESLSGDARNLARLEREAKMVAALNHPNIVVLYSVEEAGGIRFLTMELVDGHGLDQLVTPGGLQLARLLELAIPLADALAAAHERRVVHRDLKPANVMVTREGRVKVLDFGIAKSSADETSDPSQFSTATRSSLDPGGSPGTLPYMSPEQIRGEPVDARTDLFSFGILMYELATGRRPFGAKSSADLASSILRDPPTPLPGLRGDLPADLVRIIERCLEKVPDRRIQTAKDIRNELELLRSATGPARPANGTPSIAVLPFTNLGHAEEDVHFADGITEDVIAQLCKVRTLRVISRASVMPFRNREVPLREIASRLQVASVLDGSVRRVGDRVRIVAQLIEVPSGRSLWAETYDRQLTDIFAIQTDVALQLVTALEAELSPGECERIGKKPTQDLQAYDLYLQGRFNLVRYTTENMTHSIELFDQAIARDPKFALAYVGRAIAYTELVEISEWKRDEAGNRALSSAAQAVELDPELGDAHCALAFARLFFEFDWLRAEAGFKRALELSPGSADPYDYYGRLCSSVGRFDEAIAFHDRAHELDPLAHMVDAITSRIRAGRNEEAVEAAVRAVRNESANPRLRATYGWALFRLGRTQEGIAELERAVSISLSSTLWMAQLGQAYGLVGRTAEARDILRRLEDPSRETPTPPYHLAYVLIGLGDTERALDCLELAFAEGKGPLYGIQGSFLLSPLRDHPRFTALLERIHLV